MGDKSYSFLQKDSSVTVFSQLSVARGEDLGFFENAKLGAGAAIPEYVEVGGGLRYDLQILTGEDKVNGSSVATTITASQLLSTSDDDVFAGSQGDVYVGASYNIRYGLVDIIKLDDNCQVETDVTCL